MITIISRLYKDQEVVEGGGGGKGCYIIDLTGALEGSILDQYSIAALN